MKQAIERTISIVCLQQVRALILGMVIGCAGSKLHPGTVNAFDSGTADALAQTQQILEGLSAHINDYPKAIGIINTAREDYNHAHHEFLLWRCVAAGAKTLGPNGGPCPAGITATQASVRQELTKSNQSMQAAQAAATPAPGGKP